MGREPGGRGRPGAGRALRRRLPGAGRLRARATAAALHATLVALRGAGGWRGALLRGPSGAGKSDLALRALGAGFRLVADDRVVVWASGGAVYGRAPDVLGGLMEVRGLGVEPAAALPFARVALVADLRADVERMPEPDRALVAGVALPRLDFDACGRSAPLRLARALEALAG